MEVTQTIQTTHIHIMDNTRNTDNTHPYMLEVIIWMCIVCIVCVATYICHVLPCVAVCCRVFRHVTIHSSLPTTLENYNQIYYATNCEFT